MTSHDTLVIGANEMKEIVFFKSFEYKKEKEEAQLALTHAQTFPIWYISALQGTEWRICRDMKAGEEENFSFKIPKQL